MLRPGTPDCRRRAADRDVLSQIRDGAKPARTLEQQVNAAEMPEDVKGKLQGYIRAAMGPWTSFNIFRRGRRYSSRVRAVSVHGVERIRFALPPPAEGQVLI